MCQEFPEIHPDFPSKIFLQFLPTFHSSDLFSNPLKIFFRKFSRDFFTKNFLLQSYFLDLSDRNLFHYFRNFSSDTSRDSLSDSSRNFSKDSSGDFSRKMAEDFFQSFCKFSEKKNLSVPRND